MVFDYILIFIGISYEIPITFVMVVLNDIIILVQSDILCFDIYLPQKNFHTMWEGDVLPLAAVVPLPGGFLHGLSEDSLQDIDNIVTPCMLRMW